MRKAEWPLTGTKASLRAEECHWTTLPDPGKLKRVTGMALPDIGKETNVTSTAKKVIGMTAPDTRKGTNVTGMAKNGIGRVLPNHGKMENVVGMTSPDTGMTLPLSGKALPPTNRSMQGFFNTRLHVICIPKKGVLSPENLQLCLLQIL